MIRLVVAKPVYQKNGSISSCVGYEYRVVYMSHEPVKLGTEEKVMFALPMENTIHG
jgi:hypothetical protein